MFSGNREIRIVEETPSNCRSPVQYIIYKVVHIISSTYYKDIALINVENREMVLR